MNSIFCEWRFYLQRVFTGFRYPPSSTNTADVIVTFVDQCPLIDLSFCVFAGQELVCLHPKPPSIGIFSTYIVGFLLIKSFLICIPDVPKSSCIRKAENLFSFRVNLTPHNCLICTYNGTAVKFNLLLLAFMALYDVIILKIQFGISTKPEYPYYFKFNLSWLGGSRENHLFYYLQKSKFWIVL